MNDQVLFRVALGIREQALVKAIAAEVLKQLKAEGIQAKVPSTVEKVQILANTKCISCHDGSDAERMNLTNMSELNGGQLAKVFALVAADKMPKNAPPLSDVEKNEFLQFLIQKGNQ